MPRKPDALPDWFVGGRGKRQLFRAVVDREADGEPQPWSKAKLAKAAGLHGKHTIFRHLEVLVLAEVLIEGSDGYRVNEQSPLLKPLAELIDELDRLGVLSLPASRGR
jgi:hypothetical protein